MADGHGGPRTPAHPAPVSGPGALSQRTDGGPTQGQMIAPGNAYGERADMQAIQSGAPMAGGGGLSAAMLPKLTDPTARPDEPVTAGADAGPGIGMQAAGIGTDQQITLEQMRPLWRSLNLIANLPGSNPDTRTFVRALRSRISNG